MAVQKNKKTRSKKKIKRSNKKLKKPNLVLDKISNKVYRYHFKLNYV